MSSALETAAYFPIPMKNLRPIGKTLNKKQDTEKGRELKTRVLLVPFVPMLTGS